MTTTDCVYATRPVPTIGDPPPTCSGDVVWRLDRNAYCEAHGAWHAAVSPFAGYRRVTA